jgi:DNA repair exonuclease SbcCD ATPase subunit
LKVLIEEAAGVEILTEAYSVARSRLIGSKALLDTQNGLHSAALERQVRLDMELLDQKRQSQEFEDGRRDRAKAELSKAIPLGAEVSELKTKIIGLNEPMVKKELEEIQAQMASFNADQAHYDGLAKLATDLERDTGRLKTEFNMIAGHLKTAEAALSDIDSQVGKPCGECGKVYCEHDLEAAKKVRLDGIAEYKRVLKSKATAFKVVQESVETAIRVAATYKATLPDVSSVAARQSALTIVVSGIVGMRSDIELAEKEIKQLKINANTRLTEANPWTKAIEVKAEEAVNNAADIVRLAGSVASLEGQTNLLSDAAKVFGPAGVRAHILDTVTPYLNERTQEYLGALSDGNIHATWATLSKTAKGELREKFNIEVTNDKGAESFAGMSGGEKRKVRLATAMALQDMVASRASKPINIFIADEVDHALDEFGLERLMGILERKARDRGSVLVISHNSLSDWIDNVITVKKNGGLASVSGATSHGF